MSDELTIEMPHFLATEEGWQECIEHIIERDDATIRGATGQRVFFLNVYETDRVYGGPEEGGWWYNTGVIIESRIVQKLDEARQCYARLRAEYPAEPVDGPGIGSVAYRGGVYAIAIESEPGQDYPQQTPHYE